ILAPAFIDIYPNPSADRFHVDFSKEYNGEIRLSVVNMLGTLVKEATFNPSVQGSMVLDMEGEASGMYFVRIENEKESIVRKVMLSR
ncbi:MAG: T9SS type A sorting domain-containing protein, partial [Bacteroidota bacterium]